MAIKSRAARLLEKMSSKEKKVVYDVNGAQEVKETEQKKMEKPCCCKESYVPNTIGEDDYRTFKNIFEEMKKFMSIADMVKDKGAQSRLFRGACKDMKKAASGLIELLDAYMED